MTENKVLQKIGEDLAGSDGIVYLMFLGRDMYIAQIQKPLLQLKRLTLGKRGLFKNKENVNQAFKRLREKGDSYLRFVREEGKAGNPRIYAASMEPIFATLRRAGVQFDETMFESLLKSLSGLNDEFSSYLINASTLGGYLSFSPKSLEWPRTLGFYFMFLATSLYNSHVKPSKIEDPALKETPLFHAVSFVIPSSVVGTNRDKLAEVMSKNPNIAFNLLNVAILLLFYDNSAREMIPSHVSLLEPSTLKGTSKDSRPIQYQFYLDTFIQFNRLIMWVFMPDHLSRPALRNKIDIRVDKMLATSQELDTQERSQLISDCWGSIATFWWCIELQSDGKCVLTDVTCPVWPSLKDNLFRPKISPMKCQYIRESLNEFRKGKQYFDYGQRVNQGKSTSMLDLM